MFQFEYFLLNNVKIVIDKYVINVKINKPNNIFFENLSLIYLLDIIYTQIIVKELIIIFVSNLYILF